MTQLRAGEIMRSAWSDKNIRCMGENTIKRIFFDNSILNKYEQEERWEHCVLYLFGLDFIGDKNILFRLAAQCWYTLVFWDCFMHKNFLDRNLFVCSLERAYHVAREYWWTDSTCMWLFGYFMCIDPNDFPFISRDTNEIECKGNELICNAHIADPNNPLAEILFLADNGTKRKYDTAKKRINDIIEMYFGNESLVDIYFKGIFTNN